MVKSIEELVSEPWRKKLKWDVTHAEALLQTEENTFVFDPLLSYETTGYRPITETLGLDFDPVPFKSVGMERVRSGSYTGLQAGTKRHRDWWAEQYEQCENGMINKNYRVTGDHYFFLNFYSMLVVEEGKKAGAGRNFTHPSFWSAHYEWFHYIELAEILGYDVAGLKGRGVGFSEIGASLGVRPFVTTPWYNTVYLASYEPFLTGKGIIQKCWTQLDWLNQNSEDGMRRVRQAVNQSLHKRASKLNKENEEFGHMAQISGQVVDKPDKLRGDRTERLIFEESGSNPYLLDTYAVSEALVIFGTGGDTEESATNKNGRTKSGIFGLEKIFLNPRSFTVLPYRHRYNMINEYTDTAYFLPSWRTVTGAMDHRGVANEEKAKAYYMKKRKNLESQPESYLRHCAEYCFTYEEALSRKGSNRFDQVKLADQRVAIEIHKSTPRTRKGHLSWQYESPNSSRIVGVKFTEHAQGTVELVEEPATFDGLPIADLYVAGIDSIDAGVSESIVGKEGSKFCIVVKKRTYGMAGNQYVCKYLDRPNDVREAYEKAAMILWWYNCKANIEDTKVALKVYFREKGWMKFLMRRPKYATEGQSNNLNAANLYGTQASEKMIDYGLDLVRDYINDYYENMYFLDMVQQCQEYSYENKGKFDVVAAMQMCEIGDQDMMGITPRKQEENTWEDVGYWKDKNGQMHHGVIPKETNNEYLFRNVRG
jgi:hypothetical protein